MKHFPNHWNDHNKRYFSQVDDFQRHYLFQLKNFIYLVESTKEFSESIFWFPMCSAAVRSKSSRVSMTTWFLWFCHAKFDNICGDFLFLCANDNFTKKKCHYDVLCPSKLHCLFLFEYSHLLFFKVQFFDLCHENFELTRVRFKKVNGGLNTNKLTWNDWRIGVFLKNPRLSFTV